MAAAETVQSTHSMLAEGTQFHSCGRHTFLCLRDKKQHSCMLAEHFIKIHKTLITMQYLNKVCTLPALVGTRHIILYPRRSCSHSSVPTETMLQFETIQSAHNSTLVEGTHFYTPYEGQLRLRNKC